MTMVKQKESDYTENDVELERLLDVVAQEFHYPSTIQSWCAPLGLNKDKKEVQTSQRQGNDKGVMHGDKKLEALETNKELSLRSVYKKAGYVCERTLNGLHEWHELVHAGLATSQTCSEILHKVEKTVFEMQAITAAVQNQGDHLSQNASLILVREAKLEAVKEELERTLTHFRHIDDLVHEAHDPMLSATSVRFATLIEGLHNELTFLSAHRDYKSTQEYTTKVADAQERVTACLTDALVTSFELASEFTRKSNVYLHAVQEENSKRLNEECKNTSVVAPKSAVTAAESTVMPEEQEKFQEFSKNKQKYSDITLNNKTLDASQHVSNKEIQKVTQEEKSKEIISTQDEYNNRNSGKVAIELINHSLQNICKEFAHVLDSINGMFVNKLSEKASLRRMFEMRVNFQLLELAQSHDALSLTSSNSDPKGHKRKGSYLSHESNSNYKSAANSALEQFMESNVSQYRNTMPLYVQTVCQTFIAIRLSLLQELLHTFSEKCVELLHSMPAKNKIDVKMANRSSSEQLASFEKTNHSASNNTQVNEKVVQPLTEEMGKVSESNIEREQESTLEERETNKNVIDDNTEKKEVNKSTIAQLIDNSATTYTEKMSKMQDVHLLPRITRCLVQLMYIILLEEEEILGSVWLREEMVKVILIPQFTRGVVEYIYCVYRAQLVNVDDLHELVDAIREIDTMRQYWRLYKDGRRSNKIDMDSVSVTDNNYNRNSDVEEYLFFLTPTRDVVNVKTDNLIDDAQNRDRIMQDNNDNDNNCDDINNNDDNVTVDKSGSDKDIIDSLWMRMIQDTQERIIFRASVFLRQESARNQVTNEQVIYFLNGDIHSVEDATNKQSKTVVETDNSEDNNTKQSMNDSVKKTDVGANRSAHVISFHPCVVRAVGLLQLLYPVLELSVFAIFAEEAVRLSLHVIEELRKLMYNESRNRSNKNSSSKIVEDNEALGKVKALLCTLSHLVYLHEQLTHIGADITVVTKSLDLSKLLHSRLAISESARETKRDVDEALYNCFDNLVKEIDTQLTTAMQGIEHKGKLDVQVPIASVEHVAERIEYYVLLYISNESLRDDIMQPVQQRIAEMRNNTAATLTAATTGDMNATTLQQNK